MREIIFVLLFFCFFCLIAIGLFQLPSWAGLLLLIPSGVGAIGAAFQGSTIF